MDYWNLEDGTSGASFFGVFLTTKTSHDWRKKELARNPFSIFVGEEFIFAENDLTWFNSFAPADVDNSEKKKSAPQQVSPLPQGPIQDSDRGVRWYGTSTCKVTPGNHAPRFVCESPNNNK